MPEQQAKALAPTAHAGSPWVSPVSNPSNRLAHEIQTGSMDQAFPRRAREATGEPQLSRQLPQYELPQAGSGGITSAPPDDVLRHVDIDCI
jgi:hypothetical protein